jgi:hypothetical protein
MAQGMALFTNDRLISREVEENYLALCDGTCTNQSNCICVKHFGTELCGKSIVDGYCVLCCRNNATTKYPVQDIHTKINSYVNISSDYPIEYFFDHDMKLGVYNGISGCFVKYNKLHYRKAGVNSIEQVFSHPIEKCWLSTNFSVVHTEKKNDTWEICFCSNNNCKLKLLSSKTQKCKNTHRTKKQCNNPQCKKYHNQFGIGVEDTFFNLGHNTIQCSKCSKQVSFVSSDSETNLVNYENQVLTRCNICHTLIDFQPCVSVQCCSYCLIDLDKERSLNILVCARCNCNINYSKRGGGVYSYKVLKDDGQEYELYLCKKHKLKKLSKSIYDESEFFDLIS